MTLQGFVIYNYSHIFNAFLSPQIKSAVTPQPIDNKKEKVNSLSLSPCHPIWKVYRKFSLFSPIFKWGFLRIFYIGGRKWGDRVTELKLLIYFIELIKTCGDRYKTSGNIFEYPPNIIDFVYDT